MCFFVFVDKGSIEMSSNALREKITSIYSKMAVLEQNPAKLHI
jgi:hypothetical protein